MKKFFKSFIFLPLILGLAVALVVMKVKSKAPIEHEEVQFPVKAVEVITVSKIPFRARAMAFGNVEPSTILKAKAEVAGKISYIHPKLKKGASIKKGTVVLRIEPTSFKLSLNQSKAGLAGSQSSLAQLQTEEKSTKRALSISQKNLNVGLKELNRIKSLWNKRLIARSTLDKEEQKVLSLRQQVQDIQGKLSSYASRKAATRAQINQSKSQVDQSKDTLGKTEVVMPFDARVGKVSIEKGEFTPAGGLLFEALGVQAIEINAQLPTKQFRPLISGMGQSKNGASMNLNNPASLQMALSKMNLEARVRLVGDSSDAAIWEGQLIHLSESVDPTRDTLGLVIAVDKPYEGIIPGKRPPLLKGMYTSVELFSPAMPSLVVPRKAVHQGRVYVANDDNTLEVQPIHILFQQGDMVVLDAELDGDLVGKKIIITDVVPVMEGMPLKTIDAEEYQKQLAHHALGEDK
ncbi:MAG TPA: HlyD family secretion protein [Leucothrix sp.]|nr:HlyD family secretion protein [Leucothrix sp.]